MTLYESSAIIRLAEIDFERVFVLRELSEIFFCDFFFYLFFLGRVHQGNAGAFEAGTGKAATIDAVCGEHGFVNGDEFRATTFVTVDAGFAGGFAQTAKPFQVAGFPGCDAFTDALVL